MFQEFKAFIARGNVLDLAVAVVIGAAFGGVVTSLTDDLLMPLIGAATGGVDFSSHYILLGKIPANYSGSLEDYAALKKAGVAMFGIGKFVTAIINFVIIAFVIFMVVRAANKMRPAAASAGPTPTEALLAEIRDQLKVRQP